MKVLVACEESQAVCIELRKRNHEAYSCDTMECSGGHPEWHIKNDCIPILDGDCDFYTMDGMQHHIGGEWDLIIAHPPCTYLSVSGNRWFNVEKYGEKALQRIKYREESAEFFMKIVNAKCEKIVIENPIGYMNTHYRKCDQYIQPWMFGDNYSKCTCLWLKGVKPLIPEILEKPEIDYLEWVDKKTGRVKRQDKASSNLSINNRGSRRSKTFPGIARAFAEQFPNQ